MSHRSSVRETGDEFQANAFASLGCHWRRVVARQFSNGACPHWFPAHCLAVSAFYPVGRRTGLGDHQPNAQGDRKGQALGGCLSFHSPEASATSP